MRIISITIALLLSNCSASYAQSISEEAPDGKHSYDSALDECSNKEGLAMYTVSGDVVKFSCAEDLTRVYTISY